MVGPFERNVNIIQEVLDSTATHGGRIASIVGTAVRDIIREVNELISEGFELVDGNRHADADEADVVDGEVAETEEADDDVATEAEVVEHEDSSVVEPV